jgi:hypothetical protein
VALEVEYKQIMEIHQSVPNLPEKKIHLRSPKKKSHRVQFVDPVVPEYLDQEVEAE